MKLLLLLSALFSALTGVGGATRAVEPAVAMAGSGVHHAVRAAAATKQPIRPGVWLPTLRQIAAGVALSAPMIADIPAYLTRRRE